MISSNSPQVMNEYSMDKDQKTPELFKSLGKLRGESEQSNKANNDFISFKGELNSLSQKAGFVDVSPSIVLNKLESQDSQDF